MVNSKCSMIMAMKLHEMSHYCTICLIMSRKESCNDCNPWRDSNPEGERD